MDAQKIKVWSKFIGTLVIIIAAGLVIFMNRNNKTDVWVFHNFQQVGVLWIIIISAVVALIGWKILGTLRQTIKELKQLGNK